VAAQANNGICSVGVAYEAGIGGESVTCFLAVYMAFAFVIGPETKNSYFSVMSATHIFC